MSQLFFVADFVLTRQARFEFEEHHTIRLELLTDRSLAKQPDGRPARGAPELPGEMLRRRPGVADGLPRGEGRSTVTPDAGGDPAVILLLLLLISIISIISIIFSSADLEWVGR